MRTRVLIAADVDPVLLDLLTSDGRFDVDYHPCRDEAELAARIAGASVLVSRHHNTIGPAAFAGADSLRVIVQGTSGLDNIDADTAAARGVRIIGVPGENANAVAELVVGHLIALTRTVPLYSGMVRRGEWIREDCSTRRELSGYRLGIVGIERVGTRVSQLASGFGMAIAAYDPYLSSEQIRERGARRVETLDALLGQSDILTLHVPLNAETRGMVDRKAIGTLPPGAFVVNTSRGAVVDQEALLSALSSGRLGGVAMDVFEKEPPAGAEWPSGDRLILTPHVAGCSKEAKESISRAVYLRICEFIEKPHS
ncbi:MAG: NAD(P)-dependent oxidoreductase [Thermoanaerobaculia bacterium]